MITRVDGPDVNIVRRLWAPQRRGAPLGASEAAPRQGRGGADAPSQEVPLWRWKSSTYSRAISSHRAEG